MSINKFFDFVIWWQWIYSHGQLEKLGLEDWISFHGILCENSKCAFLIWSWTNKETSRSMFYKPYNRPTSREKENYFVHWCMKILAKRKKRKQISSIRKWSGQPKREKQIKKQIQVPWWHVGRARGDREETSSYKYHTSFTIHKTQFYEF